MSGWVRVVDDGGQPADGATVSTTWTRPDETKLPVNSVTNKDGIAAVILAKGGPGTYTLTVTDVLKPGYNFDPENSDMAKRITR